MAFPRDPDLTGPMAPDADRDGIRFPPGTLLLGRFRVIRLLGAGGMGEVYEAEDQELREHVALKTIRLRHSQDISMLERLRKEVQLGRKISHPNVCRLFDVFRVTLPATIDHPSVDCAIVTMELLRGKTLSERIREEGPMDLAEALPLAQHIAEGLQAAHDAGVVHRDLKSANVFLAVEGETTRAVITDFGLATTVRPDAGDWPELSMTGAVIGTLAYMSPEQLRGEPATPRSDIYAFGIVLYQMVSGVLPFRALTPMAAALKRVNEKPEDLRQHLPAAPTPWHDTIHRCLALSPDDRFPRAVDVAAGLTRVRHWIDRPLVRWATTLAIIAIIVGGSAVYVRILKQESTTAATPQTSVPVEMRARPAVALFGFKNVSNRPEFAYISTALDQGLGSELAMGERVRIVSGEEVARLKRELDLPAVDTLAGDTLRKVRASLGSDLIVLGSYTAAADGRLRVDFRVQNTQTGETMAAWSHTGTEAGLLDLISESGAAARDRLDLETAGTAPGQPRPEALTASNSSAGLPGSSEGRRLYAEGLDALRGFDARTARDLFEKTIAQEPDFVMAHVGLSMAWAVLGYDAQAVREAAAASQLAKGLRREQQIWIDGLRHEYTRDWPNAIAAYRSLVSGYPDDPEYVIRLADAQTSGGVPKDALATITAARKRMPGLAGDPRLLMAEASAAEALGDAKQQEAAARAAVARASSRGERLLVARASIALGRALQLLGNPAAALEANETAHRLYEAAGDRRGVARALIQLGDLAGERNDLANAERHLRTALDIGRNIGNKRQTMQALNALANVYFTLRRFAPAAEMYDEALGVSREVGDRSAEALALGNLASVRHEQGRVIEALDLDRRSLAIKRDIGDRRSVAFSLTNMAETSSDLGRLDAAQKMYEESREINQSLSDSAELSYSLSGLAGLAMRRDDLAMAQQLAEEALRLRVEARDADGLPDARLRLATVIAERGDVMRAMDILNSLRQDLSGSSVESVVRAAILDATLSLGQGRVADARRALSAARTVSDPGLGAGVRLALTDARVLAAEGKTAAALAAAREVRDRMRTRQLLAYELEAELALLQIRPDRAAARRLASRANDAGFLLIARKAAAS